MHFIELVGLVAIDRDGIIFYCWINTGTKPAVVLLWSKILSKFSKTEKTCVDDCSLRHAPMFDNFASATQFKGGENFPN